MVYLVDGILKGENPVLYRQASKKNNIVKLKQSLGTLQSVSQSQKASEHLRVCYLHFSVSLMLYQNFLHIISRVKEFSLSPDTNVVPVQGGQSYQIKKDSNWYLILETVVLAFNSLRLDENGNTKFRKDLSAQNVIVASLLEIFNNQDTYSYLRYRPSIPNLNRPEVEYDLNIESCMKNGCNKDEMMALFKLCKYFFKQVFFVFNANHETVNNQKTLKSVQFVKTNSYVGSLFKNHHSLFLLRGGINLISTDRFLAGSPESANSVLLKIASQFFKKYKQTPLGKLIHGFMWRLEPNSKINHVLQFVFFCDAGFMQNYERELKSDIKMLFEDIAQTLLLEQQGLVHQTLNLDRVFQVEFFKYLPTLTMSVNEELSRPISRTKTKRKIDKEDLVLNKMYGLVSKNRSSEEREALTRLIYYFCHIQDHFEFKDVPVKLTKRKTKDGVKEYFKSVKTYGRGQEHAKKDRKKRSK